ncbi:MAG TPA: MFS transporter [Thermoplasmata archaeon]|nr:MFS transporter [Thermoplasmata archaeon]
MGEPPPPTGPGSGPFRILRSPNFRRLWVGAVTSALGTSVGTIVLLWIVYQSTDSPLAISFLGIVQFLPTLVFGLLAGALIDRLDRRRLMLVCDVGRAACFGMLALLIVLVGVNLPIVLAIVFAVATFSTVFRPATNAAVPRILGPAELSDGNGLLQGGTTVAQFVGSPLGGIFLLSAGAALGLAFNALTFALSGVLIFLMVIPPGARPAGTAPPARRSLLGDVADGLRFVRAQPALLTITGTAMAANFFLSIWGGFTVVYAADQLHVGATGFSLLLAANTAGFAIGAILPGRLGLDRTPGRWLLPTWGPTGLCLVGLAATDSLAIASALTLAVGVLLSMGNTVFLVGVQRSVPDEYLGRYFATDEAGSFAMIPAGLAVGGILALDLGIGWTYLLAGVGSLVVNTPLFLSRSVRTWGRVADRPT